ncbi:hypothetical protein PTKIN_Ptkin09bG0008200 [Pterospermum kingtungense]
MFHGFFMLVYAESPYDKLVLFLHELRTLSYHFVSVVKFAASAAETGIGDAVIESSSVKFVPRIRSGSYADIGLRRSMEDEHIRIDDLSSHLGSIFNKPSIPSAFYAVFDGHGGPDAAAYIKMNATRLFFEKFYLPQASDIDAVFLKELEDSHRKATRKALLVANAGDCRAVLCRKGVAVEMSQDHRPCFSSERKRVEELGGYIDDGYLNGYLAVTRALGDWHLKFALGSASPLIAEPDVRQILLTEDDEFMIIGCDGIWDVMSSQFAVSLVRNGLRRHDDPEECAKELVNEASRLNSSDNLTAIVIGFSSTPPQRRRSRCCSLSEEAMNRLKNLLGGN